MVNIATKGSSGTGTPIDNFDFKGSIVNNYFDEYWLGVPYQNKIVWLYLGNGITTVTPKYTDKKKTAAYYDGGGGEETTITGMTESYDFQGDRAVHNPAQDFIARMKRYTGSRRKVWLRKNHFNENEDGSLTLTTSEYGMSTLSDIDDGGGAADDNGGFKFTATYNTVPTLVEESDMTTLNQILIQTPCQNASILKVPLKQPQSEGKYKTFTPDLTANNEDISGSRPATLEEAQLVASDKDELDGATEDTGNSGNNSGNSGSDSGQPTPPTPPVSPTPSGNSGSGSSANS